MTRHQSSSVSAVLLYGSSGFVGQAVQTCLASQGVGVRVGKAPRLHCVAEDVEGVWRAIDQTSVERIRAEIADVDVVVNASGVTPGNDVGREVMVGANALFAAILSAAVERAGVRLVHVSSSAVQGGEAVLRANGPLRPFNDYSTSKALGERLVRQLCPAAVSIRPGSVHGYNRRMTRRIVAFAHSKAAFTMAPGTAPTPQMHVANVAAAICHLATTAANPPGVVLQPDEGFTTWGFLQLMGSGRRPLLVPRSLGRVTSWSRTACSRMAPQAAQQLRRLELLMTGQAQEVSWLGTDGFQLPYSHQHWVAMVQRIRARADTP